MKYFFIGEDKRNKYLKEMFESENKVASDIKEAECIVTTIPFTRDNEKITGTDFLIKDLIKILQEENKVLISGSISLSLRDELYARNITYYDLLQLEEVAIKNAIPTAEGAIFSAIQNSNITLNSSNVLILGFGRIGKVLANMLKGFGANIYVEARKEIDLSYIEAYGYNKIHLNDLNDYLDRFDFIFNTIPNVILDETRLKLLKQNALIVDLASVPGGMDYKVAKNLGINVDWALALPSKVAPKTAAIYLKEAIDKIMFI